MTSAILYSHKTRCEGLLFTLQLYNIKVSFNVVHKFGNVILFQNIKLLNTNV